MKILVTGGAGFIASHIVDAYIDLGHDIVVIDDLSSGKKEFVNKKAKFYQADIRNRNDIKRIIEKEKPEVINHHAAQISVRVSVEDPILDAQVNILGLLNLLKAGRKMGVKKIIFASSGGVVYGEAKVMPTREDYHPLLPFSPYGVTKLASEKYLHFYWKAYKIPYLALRYSNVYGPRQNPHGEAGVVAIFSLKLLKGEAPIINGSGKQTRDYIYVGDVVAANEIALASSAVGSFNIGTARQTNVLQIYEALKKACQKDIPAKHGPEKKGEQKRSCLDISLAKKLLGWQPKVDLETGLRKTIDYFRKK